MPIMDPKEAWKDIKSKVTALEKTGGECLSSGPLNHRERTLIRIVANYILGEMDSLDGTGKCPRCGRSK